MPSKVLNFDSAFSQYLYDNNNTSGTSISPYYCEYKIAQIIKKITKIKLISVEIPLLFNNIRNSTINYTSLNYLAFQYTLGGVPTISTTNGTSTTNSTTFVLTGTNASIVNGMSLNFTGMTGTVPTVTNVSGTTITISTAKSIPLSTIITFTLYTAYQFKANITENIYNNVASLLTVMNNLITADTSGIASRGTAVFSVSATNKIILTHNFVSLQMLNDTTIYNYPNTVFPFMNKVLGFNNSIDTTGVLTAVNRFNLNIDNYLNMAIINVPSSNQNANNLICSFKIPLNSVNGTIYYHYANSTYEQYIENSDINFILDKFSIKILDRFGNSINPNGADYSFTLNIEYQ